MNNAAATSRTNLEGKVAWVTGAGSGIGFQTALALHEAGATLVATDIAPSRVEAVAHVLGDKALTKVQDVTSAEDWAKTIGDVRDRFGRLDILVNNAGIMLPAPFEQTPIEMLRRQQAINVEGVWLGMQTAIPLMRDTIAAGAPGASIINISSIYGKVAGAMFAAYSATKGAVRGLSKAVAYELAKTGIRVNCVMPGPIHTNLDESWPNPRDAEGNEIPREVALAAWAALIPMGRLGLPGDIAPMIAFLASDAAGLITGAEFILDGGYTAA